jgi:dolichol-phosphate mannosyltransferase
MPINKNVAVIIPTYKVSKYIVEIIECLNNMEYMIYVVDDFCPENSGKLVEKIFYDHNNIIVIYHNENKGVGGAVLTGYSRAISDGASILVKLDGDGQMNPRLIPRLIRPIEMGFADYVKGNRFYNLEKLKNMPLNRIIGNAALSFITKMSSGYWNIYDPTNGFTALDSAVARYLPFDKISKRYFFESDMLFRLNTLRAVVQDMPMDAQYGDEKSNMKIFSIIPEFLYKNIRNTFKRIFYNYYLRDVTIGSIILPLGASMFLWGVIFGIFNWQIAISSGLNTPVGTIMISVLFIVLGMQFILAFLNEDISSVPNKPVSIFLK